MAKFRKKQNMPAENHGNKKFFVAAISVICALVVLIVAFLACKNTIYFSVAQSKAENNNFFEALNIAESASDEKSQILSDYITLRIDINENYPKLLSEFSIEKINEWNESAAALSEKSDLLGEILSAQVTALSQKLAQISSCHSQYISIRSDVLSMMDVFAEFNRLYTVAADGKNTAFTVSQERRKIAEWDRLNSNLMSFAATVPEYENIYLLNYLIKEVQGECNDLSSAMDSVIAMGYTETDLIRLGGTAQKKFPDIQNSSNESVNVLEKEKYEEFMFDGICNELADSLGEFYVP